MAGGATTMPFVSQVGRKPPGSKLRHRRESFFPKARAACAPHINEKGDPNLNSRD